MAEHNVNTVKAQIQSLINKANETTGNQDTNLTDGVNALVSGYGQGGIQLPEDMLEGLENGYDVMFYDENNKGLAFYSIRQGDSIQAPVCSVKNWVTEEGGTVVFPYTPSGDLILYADMSTLSSLLYSHFGLVPEEYPLILIELYNGSTNNGNKILFAKKMSLDTPTMICYYYAKKISFNANLYSYTLEEVVSYILETFTASNFVDDSSPYLTAYNRKHFVNHVIEGTTITTITQFE